MKKKYSLSEIPSPVTVKDQPYSTPSSTVHTSSTTQSTTQNSNLLPNGQTIRPSFMTKPIDGSPTPYSYRPPEINLPSMVNLDSDIVNKVTYNSVNKYQDIHRPEPEASPYNKISSSLSIMSGARPMAVSEQHAENSISQGMYVVC